MEEEGLRMTHLKPGCSAAAEAALEKVGWVNRSRQPRQRGAAVRLALKVDELEGRWFLTGVFCDS